MAGMDHLAQTGKVQGIVAVLLDCRSDGVRVHHLTRLESALRDDLGFTYFNRPGPGRTARLVQMQPFMQRHKALQPFREDLDWLSRELFFACGVYDLDMIAFTLQEVVLTILPKVRGRSLSEHTRERLCDFCARHLVDVKGVIEHILPAERLERTRPIPVAQRDPSALDADFPDAYETRTLNLILRWEEISKPMVSCWCFGGSLPKGDFVGLSHLHHDIMSLLALAGYEEPACNPRKAMRLT